MPIVLGPSLAAFSGYSTIKCSSVVVFGSGILYKSTQLQQDEDIGQPMQLMRY